MAQFKSKKAIVDTLKQQIQSNPKQAVRALLRIYENQNESEREHQCTMFKDGYGFTQNDAEFGSSLAEQYLEKQFLTAKQMEAVQRMMPKYAKQIVEQSIASGKIVYDKTTRIYSW